MEPQLTSSRIPSSFFSIKTNSISVLVLLCVFVFLLFSVVPQQYFSGQTSTQSADTLAQLPLRFEKNVGQSVPAVQFLSQGAGTTFFVTADEMVLSLVSDDDNQQAEHVLRMRLLNQKQPFDFEGNDALVGKTHYLLGAKQEAWVTDVPNYKTILTEEVYAGIDLRYHGDLNQLEYDFIVQPGADVADIQLSFRGQSDLYVDATGNLVFELEDKTLFHQKPIIYQIIDGVKQSVVGHYQLSEQQNGDVTVGFDIASYDVNHDLVIDPIIEYASYFGGESNDRGLAITVDESGSVYIAGATRSASFPSENAYQAILHGSRSSFIAKLNPAGDDLVYATYLGGSGDEGDDDSLESDYYVDSDSDIDVGKDITVDALGQVYIIGNTNSYQDFPVVNAIQPNYGGRLDSYIAKLSADGSELLFSTYFGGSKKDKGFGIALHNDRLFVTGQTHSNNFPTLNAYQDNYAKKGDAFVAQLSTDGSQLYYSTYLGGKKTDVAKAIAVNSLGEATVTGITRSKNNFPLFNAVQSYFGGGKQDAFITKLSADGSQLNFSTFFGGRKKDKARDIAIDSQDNIVFAGLTTSKNFPVTSAIQGHYNGGNNDGFVSKLTSDGSQILFSTYLGGNKADAIRSVAVDHHDDVYVVGTTKSVSGLPEVEPVAPRVKKSGRNIYLAKLVGDGSEINYASYLGGKRADYGYDLAVDALRSVYITGTTRSNHDFPITNPLQAVFGGKKDAFIIKVVEEITNLDPEISSTPNTVTYINEPYQYQIVATDPDEDPLDYALSTAPDGMVIEASTGLVNWTPSSLGDYDITVEVSDDKDGSATQTFTLTVIARNQAPVFSSTPIVMGLTGALYEYDVNADDADGDTITYSLSVFPNDMSIDAQSGVINWTPTSSGSVAVTVIADDGLGNMTQQSFDIAVSDPDITPPVISGVSPPDGTMTNQLSQIITGLVDEAATVIVNGVTAPVGASLQFTSLPITLANGVNTVEIVDTDASGNSASQTISIVLDTLAPTLIIDSPDDATVTNQAIIEIKGSLNEAVSAVTLNGEAAIVDINNQFVGTVTLIEGDNSIIIVATDLAGNSRSVPLDITLDSLPPETPNLGLINRGNPANGIVMVSGLAGSAEAGTLLHIINTSSGVEATTLVQSDGNFSTDIAAFANDDFTLFLVDAAANQSANANLVTTSPLSLTLDNIGDRITPLGQVSRFTVIANDSDTDTIELGVTPIPLPEGMTFNIVTGEFVFRPSSEQVGDIELTFSAQTADELVTETVTMTVPTVNDAEPTVFTGRVMDANSFVRDDLVPVISATVTFLDSGVSTTTDADGYFTLTGLPADKTIFDIDASTANPAPGGAPYASFREGLILEQHVVNQEERPFFLPRIEEASLAQVLPTQATSVVNTELGVRLDVPANTAKNNDGSPFTGELSISEVPLALAPVALPEGLDPGLLITTQPVGVRFTTPVPITYPNIDNLPANSEVDLYQVDRDLGTFVVIGRGRVSSNGQQINTISGGVTANTWGFPAPAPVEPEMPMEPELPEQDNDQCNSPCENIGSTVSLADGRMGTTFNLPTYRSLETNRSLLFSYQSNRAKARPVIPFNIGLRGGNSAVPNTISYQLSVTGLQQGKEVFVNAGRLRPGGVSRSGFAFDGGDFKTGQYPYSLRVTNNYTQTRISSTFDNIITIHNEEKSPFGAGWMLNSLYQLTLNMDGRRTLISPQGQLVTYTPQVNDVDSFDSPAANFATLKRNGDGSYTHTEKDGIKMVFNAQGVLQQREDRNGNRTLYVYDSEGKLISITDPVGLVTQLVYGVSGKLNTVTDPANRVTTFEHDAVGNLTGVTFPDGTSERFTYDQADSHLMTQRFDERNNQYQYQYDNFGRLIGATLPDGEVRATANQFSKGLIDLESGLGTEANPAPVLLGENIEANYVDARGNLSNKMINQHGRSLLTTDELGRTTTHVRDADSNATQTTRPIGSVVNRTFDNLGNVLTQTEAFNNATVRYAYDQFSQITQIINQRDNVTTINRDPSTSNVLSIVNAIGHTATMQYDSRGLLTQSTSPNGLVTDYDYNTQGLLETKTETPPAASPGNVRVTSYSYYPTGLLQQVITPDSVTLTYTYDARSMLTQVTDNLNQSIHYTYDDYKNVIKTETTSADDSLALLVERFYDVRNRLIKTSAPHIGAKISEVTRLLDQNSNLIGLTDPNGHDSSNRYDAFNRLESNTHREGGVTQYDYDDQDRITKVTAPNGAVTEYEYDIIARRTKEMSPDRGTTTYDYDLANNVTSITEGRGITTTLAYDELERLVTKTYPNTISGKTEDVTYTYDSCDFGLGALCARIDESGLYSYRYDAYGNLTQSVFTEIAGTSYTTAYQYDDGDRLSQMALPSGRVIDYQRDGVRRINQIDTTLNGAAQNIVRDIQYRGDNQLLQCTFGNGLIDTRHYDLQGRLIDQLLATATDVIIDQRIYSYDKNSNILSIDTNDEDNSYGYDKLDRLITDSINSDIPFDFSYDLNHNRQNKARQDSSLRSLYEHQVNSNKLLVQETVQVGSSPLPTLPNRQFVYNDVGRLYQLIENGTLKAAYIYNDAGLRTRKTTYQNDGLTIDSITIYHYDQMGYLVTETTEQGNLIKDYIWQEGMTPLAQIDNDLGIERISYLYTDHLMTNRLATDEFQQVVWRWEGEAFGNTAAVELSSVQVNLRFPGQYYDNETNLHYNHFRYYDPSLGRYITSDPIGLRGGLNTFGYVNQSPIIHIDRLGLEVTMNCRPLDSFLGNLGKKHCSVIVWHWDIDGECNKVKIIDRQYSLSYGGNTPLPQNSSDPTYKSDTDAFNSGNGNHDISSPPGMTHSQWDTAVTNAGNSYIQGEYNPVFGPNSNTAADNIIEFAGGKAPNVPGAQAQNHGE